MFGRLRKPSRATVVAGGLLESARAAARSPVLFGEGRIPDTLDGRFESMALHVGLLILRVQTEGEEGAEVAQALFDAFFRDLDSAVRELGAFDLSVAKKIRRMGEAFYGRLAAYRTGLQAEDDAALRDALARNVFAAAGAAEPFLDALTSYVRASDRAQRAQAAAALLAGEAPRWAELPA
jgi:cytochrome b pre-mRNA-processing protein 3